MKGIDLSLFQFDFDQTWAVFFVNSDRTIYGRYGTRSADRRQAGKDVSIAGVKEAIRAALEIHAAYPRNKDSLAGKTGPAPLKPTAEKFPALQDDRYDQALPHGCIHCHNVWEGIRKESRTDKPVPDEWLWLCPMPDALGLNLDVDERATVKAVAKGSAAEKAGFKAKDRILALDGQPMISVADVQWVLDHAKTPGSVAADVERGGKREALALALEQGWRRSQGFEWRESTWPLRPGMRLDPLPDDERRALGGGNPITGLKVANAWPNQAAAKAGIKTGDVILSVDGLANPMTEADFLAYLYQTKQKGQDVELALAHGAKRARVKLEVP